AMSYKRLPGLIDPIKQLEKSLLLRLRDGDAHRFSKQVSFAKELLVKRVDHLEDMFRPTQYREQCRRLLKEVHQPFALLLQLADQQRALLLQAFAIGNVTQKSLPAAIGQNCGAHLCINRQSACGNQTPLL